MSLHYFWKFVAGGSGVSERRRCRGQSSCSRVPVAVARECATARVNVNLNVSGRVPRGRVWVPRRMQLYAAREERETAAPVVLGVSEQQRDVLAGRVAVRVDQRAAARETLRGTLSISCIAHRLFEGEQMWAMRLKEI